MVMQAWSSYGIGHTWWDGGEYKTIRTSRGEEIVVETPSGPSLTLVVTVGR
jgi:hypothetical protein